MLEETRSRTILPISAGVAWHDATVQVVCDHAVSTLPHDGVHPCAHAKNTNSSRDGRVMTWVLPFALVTYDRRGVVCSVLCAECMKGLDLPASK